MTSRQLSPAAIIAVAGGFVIALSGCAGSVGQMRLPTKLATPPVAAISAPAMTPRQQVLAAVAGYTTALSQAESSRNAGVAGELLRPYLAAARIGGLVQAMSAIWARGETFNGHDVRHVLSVAVLGGHALVHDCDNTSGMALVDSASGQIVPGSTGTTRANFVTHLDCVSGHWLVQFQVLEDMPCVP